MNAETRRRLGRGTKPNTPPIDTEAKATHEAVADDCMDAGARATHGAVVERNETQQQPANPETITMRISEQHQKAIKTIVHELAGTDSSTMLFGSRVDDNQHGGDVDLLIETSRPIENPAWLAARLSAKISRLMRGRKVDILLSAPSLQQQPIHTQAKKTGVQL